jgi:hypothetical protein
MILSTRKSRAMDDMHGQERESSYVQRAFQNGSKAVVWQQPWRHHVKRLSLIPRISNQTPSYFPATVLFWYYWQTPQNVRNTDSIADSGLVDTMWRNKYTNRTHSTKKTKQPKDEV